MLYRVEYNNGSCAYATNYSELARLLNCTCEGARKLVMRIKDIGQRAVLRSTIATRNQVENIVIIDETILNFDK